MFNFLKRPLNQPRPMAAVAVLEQDIIDNTPPEGYVELATRLNFRGVVNTVNGDIKRNNFRKFLAENGMCVYDPVAVKRYLKSICPKDHSILWRSLTDDACALSEDLRFMSLHYSLHRLMKYESIIPEPVLMTINKIHSVFPNAGFYVSTFDVPRADPFLAVHYENMAWIIERWDEPGFRQ